MTSLQRKEREYCFFVSESCDILFESCFSAVVFAAFSVAGCLERIMKTYTAALK